VLPFKTHKVTQGYTLHVSKTVLNTHIKQFWNNKFWETPFFCCPMLNKICSQNRARKGTAYWLRRANFLNFTNKSANTNTRAQHFIYAYWKRNGKYKYHLLQHLRTLYSVHTMPSCVSHDKRRIFPPDLRN